MLDHEAKTERAAITPDRRHPASVRVRLRELPASLGARHDGRTLGSVRFLTTSRVRPGAEVEASATVANETWRFRGFVDWVRPSGGQLEVGLRVTSPEHVGRARMVEQAAHAATDPLRRARVVEPFPDRNGPEARPAARRNGTRREGRLWVLPDTVPRAGRAGPGWP